eukprot:SAG11_NODE_18792_length_481_cov_0.814136_1_plen_76_part_10
MKADGTADPRVKPGASESAQALAKSSSKSVKLPASSPTERTVSRGSREANDGTRDAKRARAEETSRDGHDRKKGAK